MFRPFVVYQKSDDDRSQSILRWIKNRVMNRNNSFYCAVTGKPGTGKTWACGSIGEQWSKYTGIPFNAKDHVFFNLLDFYKLMNRGELNQKIQRGSLIVFDEPQVSINSRTWQTEQNRAFFQILSTLRHRNICLFFATPFMKHLDKQIRMFIHADFKMKSIDFNERTSTIEPIFLDYNEFYDDWTKIYLDVYSYNEKKGGFAADDLEHWQIPAPSDAWIDIYERRKKEFTDALNLAMQKKLVETEEKLMGVTRRNGRTPSEVMELIQKYGPHNPELVTKHNISPSTIARYATMDKKLAP